MNVSIFAKRLFLAAIIFIGCAPAGKSAGLFGGDAKSDNIFVAAPVLPTHVKRIILLPLAHDNSQVDLASGCEMLTPVLQAELIKTKRFEVISADVKTIQATTGQPTWTGAEALPPDFFGSLQRVYGCDAVLFCQLTTFHAYVPLAIGWRMKLVDVATQKIIWSADVVFDASEPAVSKSAQEFEKQQRGTAEKPQNIFNRIVAWLNREPAPATDEPWTVLNSPRYFGQFSAMKLLQTLPER
jgi:hypothetical protein